MKNDTDDIYVSSSAPGSSSAVMGSTRCARIIIRTDPRGCRGLREGICVSQMTEIARALQIELVVGGAAHSRWRSNPSDPDWPRHSFFLSLIAAFCAVATMVRGACYFIPDFVALLHMSFAYEGLSVSWANASRFHDPWY